MLGQLVKGEISRRVLDVAAVVDEAHCDELRQIADDIDKATKELLLAAIGDSGVLVLPRDDKCRCQNSECQ